MNIKKIIGTLLVVAAFVVAPTLALAQTEGSQDASLEVKNISIAQTQFEAESKVDGTFVIANIGGDQSEVYYRVSLGGGYGDSDTPKNTYYLSINGPVKMKAGENKTINFSVPLPEGLIGDTLGIHVEAQTLNGKPVSADEKIEVTGFDRYITLESSNFLVDGKKITSAPTVQRSSKVMFSATLDNQVLGRFTITPTVTIYKDALIGKPMKTIQGTPTEIAYKETRDVGVEIPVLPQGSYVVRTQFMDQDGKPRAGEAISAYTVSEDVVMISNVSSSKTTTAVGEKIDLTISYDVSPSVLKAENMNISVALFNEKNELVGSSDDILSLATPTATKTVTVTAKQDAAALRTEIIVKRFDTIFTGFKTNLSADYAELEAQAMNTQPTVNTVPAASIAIILAALALMIGAVAITFKKRRMGLMVILGLVMFTSFGLFTPKAHADVGTGYCGGVKGAFMGVDDVKAAITNGSVVIIGDQPSYNIVGSSGTAKVTIRNYTDCKIKISLGSYRMFDMQVPNQEFYGSSAQVTLPMQNNGTPSSTQLSVPVSSCTSQVDAFVGINAPVSVIAGADYAVAAWIRDASNAVYWPAGTGHPANVSITYTNGGNTLNNAQLASRPFCNHKPGTPTNVNATAVCGGTINVSWTAPTVNSTQGTPTGYRVYRDAESAPAGTVTGATTFSDPKAGTSVGHYYRVEAYNSDGSSALSSPSSTVTSSPCPPGAPTGITVTPQACSSNTNTISWNSVSNATSYSVQRSTSLNGTYTTIAGATGLTTTSYNNTGLTPGTTYYYKVTATHSGGSAQSTTGVSGVAPGNCSLSATFRANPQNGLKPLNDVDLIVENVTGSATGDITYKFDCTNDGTFESTPPATSATSYTATDLCDYPTAGTYTAAVRITRGLSSPLILTTTITATDPVIVFDYSLSNSGDITATQGSAGSNSIIKTLLSGTPQQITLSVASGLPSGATASFNNNPSNPGVSNSLTISVPASVPPGTYVITVRGTATGGLVRETTFNLIVEGAAVPVTVSCRPVNPANGNTIYVSPVNRPVKWIATGPNGATYTWSGSITASGVNLKEYTTIYTTIGLKPTYISVNGSAPKACDVSNFTVSSSPGYKEF
jgi:hypothetical protein